MLWNINASGVTSPTAIGVLNKQLLLNSLSMSSAPPFALIMYLI